MATAVVAALIALVGILVCRWLFNVPILSPRAAGTYGECESCHRRITEARLEAMPAARLCIECASQRR